MRTTQQQVLMWLDLFHQDSVRSIRQPAVTLHSKFQALVTAFRRRLLALASPALPTFLGWPHPHQPLVRL